jgi:hypothetical protein
MSETTRLVAFDHAFYSFCDGLRAVPDGLFLRPMNGWSPRDMAAHLVGWNYRMIRACQAILQGQAPDYYMDAAADYANVNAVSVARFASRSKSELLEQLAESRREFLEYLETLVPGDWDADHGVIHHRGGPATVSRVVESLAGDYLLHTREIAEWLARGGG